MTQLLKCDRASLYLMRDSIPDGDLSVKLADALQRRIGGEPIQYILGSTEFMGFFFTVTPACLIPRQETEILVETAIRYGRTVSNASRRIDVLDIGTGSGCIAVSLAKSLESGVAAVDISEEALRIARANARYHGVEGAIDFVCADFFSAGFRRWPPGFFDMVVSNPPYIPSQQIDTLSIEVRHEPRRALDGGSDGLSFYRMIAGESAVCLKRRGFLLVEIGFDQAEDVRNIFQNSRKFEIIEVIKDYSGMDRVVVVVSK